MHVHLPCGPPVHSQFLPSVRSSRLTVGDPRYSKILFRGPASLAAKMRSRRTVLTDALAVTAGIVTLAGTHPVQAMPENRLRWHNAMLQGETLATEQVI